MIPRYLTFSDSKIFEPARVRVMRFAKGTDGGLKIVNSVLPTLRDNLLAHNQSYKIASSLFASFAILEGSHYEKTQYLCHP